MKLGLYKKPTGYGIRIKRGTICRSYDEYAFLSRIFTKTDYNLDVLLEILKFCDKNDVDLLMHDDIVRSLNDEIVYKYNYIIFAEYADKFEKIKKYVDKHNINIYIYTSMFAGLNSRDIKQREKSRRDITMKAKLLDHIGGKGMIYMVNTMNGKLTKEGMIDIKNSYDIISSEIVDKYFMLSNGWNNLTFSDVAGYADRYNWKTVYQPSFEYSKTYSKFGEDPKFDELCAKYADLVIVMPASNKQGRRMKKKALIEYGDFPDYYRDIDNTFIINSYYSDDSINLIRKWGMK